MATFNSDRVSKRNPVDKKDSTRDAKYGVYLGVVRSTLDQTRTGRIRVFVAELSKDPTSNSGILDCIWTSPFAGGTDPAAVGTDVKKYKDTRKSYGMWMVPPDVGNLVLVCFANGNVKFPYIISCLFPERMNHMVPGMPAGKSYGDPSIKVPVAEKNPRDERTTHDDAVRPIHADNAEWIVKQGLINDPLRGAGTSGARRESPSEVFGILTPGPRDPKNFDNRLGGHQFVMDDYIGSRHIRLRSAMGNQILLDDTQGIVYIINKRGNAWFEMDAYGNINFFSDASINMRARGNFNLRADKNINIEAGNDINMKAAGDNIGDKYVGAVPLGALGLPPLGTGGSIKLEAAASLSQYAGQSAQLTAVGGDIDVSAGGRVAVTASSPVGIHMSAPLGPIMMQSTLPTSILAAGGFNVTSGAPISMLSPMILLNSGGAPALPALPALPASQIGTSKQEDQPRDAPEFDREAALKGENAVKNSGLRKGKKDKIETIVSTLITAEPYAGHSQYDPRSEDKSKIANDPNAIKDLPPDAVDTSGRPADAVTPNGMKVGTGYTDQNGNPVSDQSSAVLGTSAGTSAASTAQTVAQGLQQGTAALNAAAALASDPMAFAQQAATKALTDQLANSPVFADLQGVISGFNLASLTNLASVGAITSLVKGLGITIPPIRFPTTTAIGEKIIGIAKQLKEYEAQIAAFGLDDLGIPADLQGDLASMMNNINSIVSSAQSAQQAFDNLKAAGYTAIKDGPGMIFQDQNGNTIVDFSNGLGPVGAALGLQGDLSRAFDDVKSKIVAPLTQNQAAAISSFAMHIGTENFLNSDVLAALNEGAYSSVPRLMQGWVMGADPGTIDYDGNSVFRQDYKDRRLYEAQIFQTPDEVLIDPPEGTAPGELTFAQLAAIIEARRIDYIQQKVREFGFA